MDVCLPTKLHVYQFIDSSIYGCEEFEILLILFFLKLHGFSVFVPVLYVVLFSCIAWHAFTWCANIYYVVPCHLPDITSCHVITWHLFISLNNWCDGTWHLICYYLTLVSCYDMTYHLSLDILILDLWLSFFREYCTCYPVLYIQWPESVVLMYTWIPDHVLFLLFP